MTPRARSSERGQIFPIFALLLVVLMGAGALAVDVGFWRYQQRLEQIAADSAAIAAADELNYTAAADWSTAALNEAAANGFTNDGVTVTVTSSNPPTTGPNSANNQAVQVVVSEKQPVLFGSALGFSSQWLSARAVAVLLTTTRNCVYALSTSGYAVAINGATLSAPNCGISSNGGFQANGSNITAAFIGYNGAYNSGGSSYPKGQPVLAIPQSDPCPSIPGCAYLKANPPSSGACKPATFSGGSSVTIPSGRYCTQLSIQGVNNVIFSAGVYELDAGLNVNGASSITGTGVTFYNGSATAAVQIQAASTSLSAPSTGNTAGIMIYQNPSNTAAFGINGGGGGLAGMLYFPAASVSSSGALSSWLLVVANTFTVSGNAVNVPTASFPGSTGRAVLAE